jgi:FkbM family methyltransferase
MKLQAQNEYQSQIEELLSESLDSVRQREQSAFENLLASCGNRIVLFGAGNLGLRISQSLRSAGTELLAFADNDERKWGTHVDGVQVLSPQDAARKYGAAALFVVSIWSLGHAYPESRAMLERLGCRRIVSATVLRWKFADQLLPDFCQDLPHKVYEQAPEVREAAGLWADEHSQSEYLSHLKWRMLGDQGELMPRVTEESYFLDSLYRIDQGEVFVDCGAYDGDTAQQVVRRNQAFSRILAIEGDPATFNRLRHWIRSLDPAVASRIEAINVAVGATRGQLKFRATGDQGACLADDGNIVVNCVPIDELTAEVKPTFIKMDIEGAELEALQGAAQVIRAHHPILSICVYHKQSDLWRIPLFIHSLFNDYSLFLRTHDVDGWQTVCYAVPRSRLLSARRAG